MGGFGVAPFCKATYQFQTRHYQGLRTLRTAHQNNICTTLHLPPLKPPREILIKSKRIIYVMPVMIRTNALN